MKIRDPGCKKLGYGIQDKHPGSAKLISRLGANSALTVNGTG
jgi:hypothetical protein